jgi:peptidoglycan-associated lipoprotein
MSLVRNSKIVALIAGALLLAACSTNATDTSSTDTSTQVATAVAGSYEDFMNSVGSRGDHVYFAFNRYDLNVTSQDTLRRQATWLQMNPAAQVTISGNCDERGTREYNLALGARRANSAKDFLISLGVDPARVSTISYGKEQPECLASNEECWAINRNGVTSITNSPTS